MKIELLDWGLVNYRTAWDKQKSLLKKVIDDPEQGYLIFCSHLPVITVGRNPGTELFKVSADVISNCGIEVIEVDRGGSITAHYPDQLVVYLILSLKYYGMGIKRFMDMLETSAISAIRDLSGISLVSRNRGLWYDKGKVVSFGIGIKKWCSYHGMAINLQTPNDINRLIYPCGEKGVFLGINNISKDNLSSEDLKFYLTKWFLQQLLVH